MEVQVSDQSTIKDILVFYRFESEKSFSPLPMNKEIFYTAIIPGISVSSGNMEYYFFARDEHGNQSTWPSGGEETPATITIFDQLGPDITKGDITIDLLHPLPNSTSSDGSIIILSLYDPKTAIENNEIILLVDNKDVSELLFTSIDLVTYVPILPLSAGDHTIQLQLADADGIYFNSEHAKSSPSASYMAENKGNQSDVLGIGQGYGEEGERGKRHIAYIRDVLTYTTGQGAGLGIDEKTGDNIRKLRKD